MSPTLPPQSPLNKVRQSEQRWWLAAGLYVLMGIIGAWQYAGPNPRPSSTPPAEVSAGRALQTLATVMGPEQKPHRAGTKENEEVRIRLLGLIDELGLETWQFSFVPSAEGLERLAQRKLDLKFTHPLISIVARIPGQPRSRPVVLSSHYDAAIEAPGAGDAGQCVAAILETVRAIQSQPLKHETWILLTDAEEFGLWGAEAFVQQQSAPWGSDKPVVINFDSRGDRGAALLYETHENNLQAMRLASQAIASPRVSTSLMVNVYKRLPNGTDFTIFRQDGWCGWNFAVVAGADRYHTPADNLQNLSPRSVQHFASHAHGLLRALDNLTADQLEQLDQSQPATFFDLLGLVLIVYPMSWNNWHWAVAASLWLISWVFGRFSLRLSRVNSLLLLALCIAAIAYGLGLVIVRGLQAADLSPRNFVQGYQWVVLAFALVAFALMFSLGRLAGWIGNTPEMIQATSLCYLLLAGLTCWMLPGGAYLFLWPATTIPLAAMVCGRLDWQHRPERCMTWLVMLACVVPALLYGPTYVLLAQTLGPRAGMVIAAAVVVMLLPTMSAWGNLKSELEN